VDVEAVHSQHTRNRREQPGAVGRGHDALEQPVGTRGPLHRQPAGSEQAGVSLEHLPALRVVPRTDHTVLEQRVGVDEQLAHERGLPTAPRGGTRRQ
jgi:hypothetical protein